MEEQILLNRFELDGKPMVDIRYWKKTKVGMRPTKKGIVIEQKMVTRLVWALHKIHENHNLEQTGQLAGAAR